MHLIISIQFTNYILLALTIYGFYTVVVIK